MKKLNKIILILSSILTLLIAAIFSLSYFGKIKIPKILLSVFGILIVTMLILITIVVINGIYKTTKENGIKTILTQYLLFVAICFILSIALNYITGKGNITKSAIQSFIIPLITFFFTDEFAEKKGNEQKNKKKKKKKGRRK